MMMMMEWWKWA